MEKCLIAAISDDNALGVAGKLPWHLSEDLKYFKRTTSGCPVIMGRRTYESLPFRPLKGRLNIVLSGSLTEIPGAECAGNLEDAFRIAGKECGAEGRCFVIGGASVYAAAIQQADTLYLTRVHVTVPEADCFFPEVDRTLWELESRSESITDGETGISYEFEIYKRKI